MKSIGKYQVIEELANSATGKTYRVRDAFRNREFALKLLQVVPEVSAEAKQQFCEYLASCAELTHRHIAKVQDLGEVDEGIFVATEWRPGIDLRQFMEENHDLPLGQKLAVIAQVGEGLAFAHSRGIAHGDLKPGNIFVDAARDIRIQDFGTAKWLAALLDAGCRPEGLVANYLSPEQVLGQPFDARSDIFALGLMLYEFAAGRYPFSSDPGLVPREIVHSDPAPLRTLDPQIPEELEQLVARALNKNPAQRLETAEEFASGLYLAAQQLRRVAAVNLPAQPPTPEPVASMEASWTEPMVNQLPPALTPEPVLPQAATPPVRERPQDVQPAAKPWTSRSYANAPITKEMPAYRQAPPISATDLPKQPPPPIPAPIYEEPLPQYQPPKSFLKPAAAAPLPAPVQPKLSKTRKGILTATVGLVLAAAIVASLVSRQNLRASPDKRSADKSHIATPVVQPVAPVPNPQIPTPAPVRETRAPKPGESGRDDLGNPEFSARQTLNGPVRTFWEAGRYAQALALVNQVLTNDPTNADAASWKKKIREAQAAEAALK